MNADSSDPTIARWQGRVDQQLDNHGADLRELRNANAATSHALSEVKVKMETLASKEDLNDIRVQMADLATRKDLSTLNSTVASINGRIAYAAGVAAAVLGGASFFFNWYFGG